MRTGLRPSNSTNSTIRSFQNNTIKIKEIATMHKMPEHASAVIYRPRNAGNL